jgi:MioC protein
VICSTHGDGGLPASAQPFAEALDEQRPDLTGLTYAMFGLGDSSYETYSRGSERIDERFAALGATRVGEYGRHDASDGSLPNDSALEWAREIVEHVAQGVAA